MTLHSNFYQNRSTFTEVMHKIILVCFYAPQCSCTMSGPVSTWICILRQVNHLSI